MAKSEPLPLGLIVLAFLMLAFVSGIDSESLAFTPVHLNTLNLTRRECVEQYNADGQPIIDDDGEPQFNCDNYFPTMQQIGARIGSTGLVNDPGQIPAYYTGWPLNEVEGELGGWIEAWMESYLSRQSSPQPQATGYYWWWTVVPRDWWSANHDWLLYNQGDGPTKVFPPGSTTVFDACISEALATLNVGKEIFLFVPSEYVLGSEPNRQWWSIEFPVLTNNPVVETIYRVDPRPAADGRVCGERVIWVNAFLPQTQTWKCADHIPPPPPPPPVVPLPPVAPPTQNQGRSSSQTNADIAHLKQLSRRECWAEEDVMTGQMEYDVELCDEYLPDLTQFLAHLKQRGLIDDPGNIAVYYTGWKPPIAMKDITDWITAYMAKYISLQEDPKPNGWYWYWSSLDVPWSNVQQEYTAENFASFKNLNLDPSVITAAVAQEVLVVCGCEAFANSCLSPTVILMVPNDYVLGEERGRHWLTIEWGALTKNTNVQKIYRVDPRPLEDPNEECDDPGKLLPQLIWERGKDEEVAQTLSCGYFVPPGLIAPPHPAPPPPPTAPVEGQESLHAVSAERIAPRSLEPSVNTIHFNKLSRRECVGTTDIMTGETQYLPENCENMAPTLAQCLEHWNQKNDDGVVLMTDPTKLPIYYTGWPADIDSADIFKWISAFVTNYIKVQDDPKETGWYWFWNTWDKDWYDVQETHLEQNADEIENILPKGEGQDLGAILDGCMNEAFATSCIYPKVFLMVPEDYVLGSEKRRHWWSIEFGVLTKNPNVQEIFRLDPRPHDTDSECTGYTPILIWSREGGDEPAAQDFYCDVFVSDTPVAPPPPPPVEAPTVNAPPALLRRLQVPQERSTPNEADVQPGNIAGRQNPDTDAFRDVLSGIDMEKRVDSANQILEARFDSTTITDAHIATSPLSGSATEVRRQNKEAQNTTSSTKLNRRQCTERNPGQNDDIWDCDEYLPTLQEILTEIQVNGLTSQEDSYAVYFTGFENDATVVGRLKGQIAAWMKWYIQCILETRQDDDTSGTQYWYWYFDVVYDEEGSWFAAQNGWIEEHTASSTDEPDGEDTFFPAEAPNWFCKCTSQAYATACEQATVILFAPYDYVLTDHPNRHFYGIEYGVLTRNPKVQRVIRADPTPPEDPNVPHSQPTVIWDRSNPAMNGFIPRYFDCAEVVEDPPADPSSEEYDDSDSDLDGLQFDMVLGAG